MTHYIIYHQVKKGIDCPDGICSAWVAQKAYPNAKVLGCSYDNEHQSEVFDGLENATKITMVDYSVFPNLLKGLVEKGIEIEVIDHHKTAWDNLSNFSDILFKYNVEECGSTLCWKHFFPNEQMPVFLNYIRDRDLWKFELPETPIVHEAMAALGRKFVLLDRLSLMTKKELLWFLQPIGEPLIEAKNKAIENAANRVQFRSVGDYDNIPNQIPNFFDQSFETIQQELEDLSAQFKSRING